MPRTIADRLIAVTAAGPPPVVVRWQSHLTPWSPRFAGLLAGSHGRIDLAVTLQVELPDAAIVACWLDTPEGRRAVLARRRIPCRIGHDDSMVHIDAADDAQRVLCLTMSRAHDRVVYARTDLLASAGFAGGCYDPPTVALVSARAEVASA